MRSVFSRPKLIGLLVVLGWLSSCKKETDIQIKEVDKTYSWTEVNQLRGREKIIVGAGADAQRLYLQTPEYLGILAPGLAPYFTRSLASLPTDINVRALLTPGFILHPASDTVLALFAPSTPVSFGNRTFLRLRRLDAQALSYTALAPASQSAIAAATATNYALLPYRRSPSVGTNPIRLLLTPVVTVAGQPPRILPQILDFPAGALNEFSQITCLQGLDDYFLVSFINEGVFKISTSGAVEQVVPPSSVSGQYSAITSFYKFRGRVYAHAGTNLFYSDNDGTSWQRSPDVPAFLDRSRFTVISDSLVGFVPGTGQLFTLRWAGATGRIRELKNDGLDGTQLTALTRLNDTVYVSTTSGLFRRPLPGFFDSKP